MSGSRSRTKAFGTIIVPEDAMICIRGGSIKATPSQGQTNVDHEGTSQAGDFLGGSRLKDEWLIL